MTGGVGSVTVHMVQRDQVAGEPHWHLEDQNAQTGVVALNSNRVLAEPEGRRLLEEVCIEGYKLAPEECDRLVVVLKAHSYPLPGKENSLGALGQA